MEIHELSMIIFGLTSAITFGAGDFTGGLATKRNNAYSVVIISQVAGILMLFGMAILIGEPIPGFKDLAWGATAGLVGAIGLVTLYRGLAGGRMGMVAPVTAIISAALPVAFGLLIEGMTGLQQLAGFLLAFLAMWLVSSTGTSLRISLSDLGLPFSAGTMFGLFFILMAQVSPGLVFGPLVAARIASLGLLSLTAILRHGFTPLVARQIPLITLAGILDACGNIFYVLAVQAGRLDIAAILASLYPATTVLLACVILKEKLSSVQWVGLLITLMAIILITS